MSRQAQVRKAQKRVPYTFNYGPRPHIVDYQKELDAWRQTHKVAAEAAKLPGKVIRARAMAIVSGDVSAPELTTLERLEIKCVHKINLDADTVDYERRMRNLNNRKVYNWARERGENPVRPEHEEPRIKKRAWLSNVVGATYYLPNKASPVLPRIKFIVKSFIYNLWHSAFPTN